MPLSDRQRGCGDRRFKGGFLGGEIALDIAVVKHAPMIAYGDYGVLSKSHGSPLLTSCRVSVLADEQIDARI
jgi:hypothetical protein